jgi:signal transduction histidine kinase
MALSAIRHTQDLRHDGDGREGTAAAAGRAHRHSVQFYESDEFLARTVSEYIAAGIQVGEPAVVIATPDHFAAITRDLVSRGVNVESARRRGMLIELDARMTLSAFMVDGRPDEERFVNTLTPVLDGARRRHGGAPVRAFGEMVNLLWSDGEGEAALTLESLWNRLSEKHDFALLCAYAIREFDDAKDSTRFAAICAEHAHVVPSESYIERDESGRLLEITLLQQRAQALESEMQRRERLEAELRGALTDREHLLAAERTARAEAEAARRVAEQANRAKSEFLAVMSHELRTPLNAIAGYAELMELGVQGPVSMDQREALERIQRSQRHLLGLINQVLNYARLETGNVRYTLVDVSADAMLRAAEALVFPQMQAKGLRYSYAGCDPMITVRADSEKLQQILLNLLGNALKFTDHSGEITVSAECTDDTVVVRVRDTGVGIPNEKLALIFDPFVQVDSRYTRTRDGIGLGLAISRDLARGMQGDLTVQSVVGVGSTFTLTLPAGSRSR